MSWFGRVVQIAKHYAARLFESFWGATFNMPDPTIVIDHLRKVYEPFPTWMKLLLRTSVTEPVVALDEITLEVFPGDVMAVLGPNGAGKSTLFRVLTGLTTPTSGSARVHGHDVTYDSSTVRRLIGFMPADDQTLLLRHSCVENLAFHGRLQGIPESELGPRIDDTLEIVGLQYARDRVGYALSSGMLARLMLARAMLHRPPVLILDEPTGAVDPIGAYELLGVIQEIARERGLAVLISSHRLDEVEMLNDRVMLLDRGKVVFEGDLDAMVFGSVQNHVAITAVTAEDAGVLAKALDAMEDVSEVEAEGSDLTIRCDLPVSTILERLGSHAETVVSIGTSRPPLRDVIGGMLRHEDGNQSK